MAESSTRSAEPDSLPVFDRLYVATMVRALVRVGATADEVDDVVQTMRAWFLLQRTGQPPLTAQASGVELDALVRVTALRTLLALRSRGARRVTVDVSLLPLLNVLPDDTRAVMRLALLHGLGVREIAVRMRMTQAAAMRLLESGRAMLRACQLESVVREVVEVLLDAAIGAAD